MVFHGVTRGPSSSQALRSKGSAAAVGLLLVYAIFKFYFIFVLGTIVVGCATFVWIRFFRFPPLIETYNQVLRRERSLSQKRFRDASATIRTRPSGRPKPKPRGSSRKRR